MPVVTTYLTVSAIVIGFAGCAIRWSIVRSEQMRWHIAQELIPIVIRDSLRATRAAEADVVPGDRHSR